MISDSCAQELNTYYSRDKQMKPANRIIITLANRGFLANNYYALGLRLYRSEFHNPSPQLAMTHCKCGEM